MALSDKAKIALGLIGGAAVVGVGVALWSSESEKKAPKKQASLCPPGEVNLGTDTSGFTMCGPPPGVGEGPGDDAPDEDPPGFSDLDLIPGTVKPKRAALIKPSADEPLGGWGYRWSERKDEVIEQCRTQGKTIFGWSAFVECVLKRAFPEATHPQILVRPAWLKIDATNKIREDIIAQLHANDISTQGWSFQLWLKFSVYVEDCYEALAPTTSAVAHCIATQIYPGESWPPAPTLSATHWKRKFWSALLEAVNVYDELQTKDDEEADDGLTFEPNF
jgi:hypothetical protein